MGYQQLQKRAESWLDAVITERSRSCGLTSLMTPEEFASKKEEFIDDLVWVVAFLATRWACAKLPVWRNMPKIHTCVDTHDWRMRARLKPCDCDTQK